MGRKYMKRKALIGIILILIGMVIGATGARLCPGNNKWLVIQDQNVNQYPAKVQKGDVSKKYKNNLIGIWHLGPNVGAGYNDHFEFFDDGTFIFRYNQYDGEKRIVDISGTWEVIHDNLLALKIINKTVIEGGEFTKDVTSQTTEYVLRNGTLKRIQVNPPEEIIYPLGSIVINKDYPYPVMMKIGGKQYWKLGSTGEEIID